MSTKHELMLARKLVKTLTQMTADASRENALYHSIMQGLEFTDADYAYGWLYDRRGKLGEIDVAVNSANDPISVPVRAHWGDIENLITVEGVTKLSQEELAVSKSLFPHVSNYNALLGAPVVDEAGDILGGICFLKAEGEFTEEDEVGLEYLALFTGLGLQMSERLQALNEAEGAKALQRNYLQQVSHDIRSPLTVISGAASLLGRPIDESKKGLLLEKIQSSSEKIGSLVEALLKISKAETGRLPLNYSTFNLSSMLTVLTNDLTPTNEERYEIVVDPSLEIETDRHHLQQLLANLINNSFAHGASPRKITVMSKKNEIIFYIWDNGPGLPPEIASRLGETYLPGATGAGLGLSISYSLAKALGGELSYTQKDGFKLTLPAII